MMGGQNEIFCWSFFSIRSGFYRQSSRCSIDTRTNAFNLSHTNTYMSAPTRTYCSELRRTMCNRIQRSMSDRCVLSGRHERGSGTGRQYSRHYSECHACVPEEAPRPSRGEIATIVAEFSQMRKWLLTAAAATMAPALASCGTAIPQIPEVWDLIADTQATQHMEM